jgi:hypothetical protein
LRSYDHLIELIDIQQAMQETMEAWKPTFLSASA